MPESPRTPTAREVGHLDAFEVHRRLIDDYREFTLGFVDVQDDRIKPKVEEQNACGAQWHDP